MSSLFGLVLLTADMVLVRVLAVVSTVADGTLLLKTGALGLDAGTGSGLENLLGENFGGDRRQTGDATLEIVSAVDFCVSEHVCSCTCLCL